MKIRNIHLLRLLAALNCLCITIAKVSDIERRHNDELNGAVKNLLDVEETPKQEFPKSNYRISDAAAKYMQKLYELYSKDKRYSGERTVVRSINSNPEVFDGRDALSFDVTSIRRSEKIIRAELHFNIRSKIPSSKIKARKFLQIIPLRDETEEKLKLIARKDGWLAFDATKLLLNVKYHNATMMRIQVLKKNQVLKAVDVLKKFTPFLLVYTKPENFAVEENFIDAIKENLKKQESKKRSKRGSDYYVYKNKKNQSTKDDLLNIHMEKFRIAGPSILRRRTKNLKHLNRRKKPHFDRTDPMMGFGSTSGKELHGPEPSTANETNGEIAMVLLDDVYTGEKCGKRKMTVSFEEIGWGEYVVQPASFEANYCSGTCTFHLDKFANSHAVFQSLIHTASLNPYVPNVCCAPEKFDSQTLLYFQGSNLVLRTFPKMIVTSCACI